MTKEQGIIQQLFLFFVSAVLGALAVIVYFNYGLGVGVFVLAGLFVLALWGTISSSVVRDAIAGLFSSGV